ncbi:MAG: hypothetical protein R2761_05890 [Acidimicrobiales bacterium]
MCHIANFELARQPDFAEHFGVEEFTDDNNYTNSPESVLLHGSELFHVAEFMRRQYAGLLAAARRDDPGSIPETVLSYDLRVRSSWRNPERNASVPKSSPTSNHQFGRALDLKPVHFPAAPATLIMLLFDAGRDLLEQLIALNGVSALGDIEVFIEKGGLMLWRYEHRLNGSIESLKGGSFDKEVGGAASVNRRCGGHPRARRRKPADPERPLLLPAIAPYDAIPPTPQNVYRNVILIASEHPGVPADKQLPLNHVADSIKRYLEAIDPLVRTEVREVSNAVEWLRYCGIFRDDLEYKIRHFFSFSHAWPGGLTLENFPPGIPVHDPNVYDTLSALYDPRPFDFSTDNFALPIGEDDAATFRTNQMRISNLRLLPQEAKERLRRTFTDARGVYIVGCRTAFDDDAPDPPFCQEMADVLGQPVWGAAYYSKILSPDPDGEWQERNLSRLDPTPVEQPVVLVPGSHGTLQYIWFLLSNLAVPSIPDFPDTVSDLQLVYQRFLTCCQPTDAP